MTIRPSWGERTCQVCGALADVIDLDPEVLDNPGQENGEGYCQEHADEYGITAEDHPRMMRPGPKRSTT
jgi:hypothetical protein